MSEPRRWLDAESGAPAGVRALLQVAQAPAELPLPARARVRAALRQRCSSRAGVATLWSAAMGAALAAAALGWLPWPPPSSGHEVGTAGTAAHASADVATRRVATAAPAAPQRAAGPSAPSPARRSTPPAPGGADAVAAAPRAARPPPTEAQRKRWRAQRWANETRRSRERIAAAVDEILKPDARLLERAGDEVQRDPGRALALIEAFRKRYPMTAVPAPSAVVEVDALRRLGRFEEALDRARALVDVPDKHYYADEMRQRFAFLEL